MARETKLSDVKPGQKVDWGDGKVRTAAEVDSGKNKTTITFPGGSTLKGKHDDTVEVDD